VAIDWTTDIGKVRLLISDVDETAFTFSDDEVTAFLGIEPDDVRLAAALALETLASNEALVFKKLRAMRFLQSDGPAVAASLMERAALLRDQAYNNGTFEIADGGALLAELAELPSGYLLYPGDLSFPSGELLYPI
jgi:hypothetical protein